MKRHALPLSLLAALIIGALFPRAARGITVQLTLTQFTGDDALVIVTLDDAGGIISGNINVQANPNIGDLRALFLQVTDESILPGLIITGPLVSESIIGDDNVDTVGNANVNGAGSPGPFDVGIAFGTPGIGGDDIQSTTFFLNHAQTDITLSMFDLTRWGIRLTSVGLPDGPREGSSKLSVLDIHPTGLIPPPTPLGGDDLPNPGIAPVPEPGTLALGAVAALFTSGWWWRRRAAAARG